MITTRVYVEHPDLALAETIRSTSDVDISVIGDAGTDPQRTVYFFRIEATEFDAVEAEIAADHTVAEFSTVLETGAQRTYRIEYSDDAKLITPAIADRGGLTLETRSHLNGWMLRLQLEGHDVLHELNEYAIEEGIRFDIIELKQRGELDSGSESDLTAAQIEALVNAYRYGYYDEPREVSLDELAEILGISNTAASGRLRRGAARLIEETLVDDE
ncbi:helix-turn-helix domain-containing protein [Halorubrum sp. DTA98]|uniref:helix-turn-helix domain-containing protein n=1 Tax=Halorubrum sp. DTA98 TaxID=3402163 RepID=UPI003AB0DC3F